MTIEEKICGMKMYKLGDLCSDVVDCPHSTPEWKNEGIRVIRNFNIVNGSLDFSNGFFVDEETFEKRTQRACPEFEDLVISREAPMGAVCMIPKNLKCCLGQRLVLLKVNKDVADPNYILFAIQSQFVQKQIQIIDQTGSIVSNLNIPDLKSLRIPLPSLPEQKKIASVLSALGDKIALNKKMNQKLEAMPKRLYDYWFVQYDFPDKNGHPYKTTGGPMTYNPTLKREIPAGWEVKTIGDYLKIGNGRDHSKLADGPYPVYGSGGLMRYVAEYLHDGETVLFPRKGTLNNVMYRNEPLWTVDTMFYTSVLVPHSALFVFYSAKMFDFERLNTGTGVPSMTSDIIKKLPIISPDRQTLEQFDKTVAKLYNQIHHNEKEISRLTKLRDKLLPLLMNGQVEVK